MSVYHDTISGTDNHDPRGLYPDPLILPGANANAYTIRDVGGNNWFRLSTSGNAMYLGFNGATTPAILVNTTFVSIATQSQTSGSPFVLEIDAPSHTTLTASVEARDIFFSLARTVQFATGALALQRAVWITQPTYGFVGASTLTTAATVAISGGPTAGTNATITNSYALMIESGSSRFNGAIYLNEISDPGAKADHGALYTKDAAGTTHLYFQDSGGTVHTLTPPAGGAPTLADNTVDVYVMAATDGNRYLAISTFNASETIVVGDNDLTTLVITHEGQTRLTGPTIAGSAGPNVLRVTGSAHTTVTAGSEVQDVAFNLNRTVQWATGAIASQRSVRFRAPTLGFVGASVVTTAAVVAIESPPVAGTNATLTKSYSLWLEGATRFGLGNNGSTTIADPIIEWNTGNGSTAFSGTATYNVQNSTAGNNRGYLIFSGAIVVPQGTVGTSTVVGYLADDGGNNSTAVGSSARANTGCTVIGAQAKATTATDTLVMSSSTAGASSTATGANSMIFAPGAGAGDGGFTRAYVFGDGLTATATNQTMFRTATFIVGNGDVNASPQAVELRGTDVTGSNLAGVSLTIRPGRSTGSGLGGSIIFQTAAGPGAGSPTTLGTLTTRFTVRADGRCDFAGDTAWTAVNPVLNTTGTDSALLIQGNRSAGSSSVDVGIGSTATRTAGSMAAIKNNATNLVLWAYHGGQTITQTVATSGIAQLLLLTGAAHTGQTAGSETIDVDLAINRTVTHASNTAITTQRNVVVRAPTHAFASATGTITDAATFAIVDAPVAGTNAAITNAYSLWVQAGMTRLDSSLRVNNAISPAQLTANQNNYAPTNFATCFLVRQDVDATGRTITGLAGGAGGRMVVLRNIGATGAITLTSEDAASTAANRFNLKGTVTLEPNEAILLLYDGDSSRWTMVSQF